MKIIDGRKLGREILEGVREEVEKLSFTPVFCDVLVGDDPSSAQYVRMKAKTAEGVGIKFHSASFPGNITTQELIKEIEKINEIENMCGIIVQLPLPKHLDRQAVLDSINGELDVDCLGTVASSKFYEGNNPVGYPTALACVEILDSLKFDLKDKNIVILGEGLLVGGPTAALLKFRGLNPITLTRKSENYFEHLKAADIIISGIGQGKFITGDMIKEGAVLIDAGTSEMDGGISGDVDLESVEGVAGYVSPVPGGVGPVTVAMLLKNVLKVAKKHE